MAINRNDFFSQLESGARWNAGVSFLRTNPLPLDDKSVFESLEDAQSYASTGATAYPGQIIAVVAADGTNTYYGITQTGTLESIGGSAAGDNKTIVLTEGGTLSLKDFGVQYYKFVPADTIIEGSWTYPGTMPSAEQGAVEGAYCQAGDQWYIYSSGSWVTTEDTPSAESSYELTQGFVDGLEPKVNMVSEDNFELAWYEPNPTTVEGLQSAVSSLQQQVGNMYTRTDIDNMFDTQFPEWETISE